MEATIVDVHPSRDTEQLVVSWQASYRKGMLSAADGI
jgi:hypothetical protein